MTPFILRPYQGNAVDATFKEWESVVSTLIVCPTGAGKTCIFSEIIRRIQPLRTLVLCHREELIFQAVEKIEHIAGIECDIEMADQVAGTHEFSKKPVVVATVQTMISGRERRRMERFRPEDFGLVIVDECHRITTSSFRTVLNWFKRNPNLKILGVTATPDRADEEALGQLLETVAFDYEITDAIEDGWLVPVQQQYVNIEGLDFSAIRTTAGDLNGGELAAVMEMEKNMHGICGAAIEIVRDRQSILFTVSVRQSEMACDILNRHKKDCAEWICGKTDKEERRKIMKGFSDGNIQILCNVGIACLDEQTEILTTDGWVGHSTITQEHNIANWSSGSVWFSAPRAIEIRERKPDERMVILETKNRSIRITEDHRMLYRTTMDGDFLISRAARLVNRSCGLPISGIAAPLSIAPRQEKQTVSASRIRSNSYKLRKQGLSQEAAKTEALARASRRAALSYALPHELTIRECEFIGFWIGDGVRSKLQSGGIEYIIREAETYPSLSQWISDLIADLGFHSIRRRKKPATPDGPHSSQWSLSRGTGFGSQVRNGIYRIEPYMEKCGSQLLWGLSCEQFEAVMSGFWMADGEHRDSCMPIRDRWRICSTNKQLFDLLQGIAVCRGYRASITDGHTNTDDGYKPLWKLSVTKKHEHRMTKFRLQFEHNWKAEKVWCVKSESGFIITRRRGTVTVTGNTEGVDIPNASVILMGRPTKSRSLYSQCAGRALRPLPGLVDGLNTAEERRAAIAASTKPYAELVDFVGNSGRHKLMSGADILGGHCSEEAIELAIRTLQKEPGPKDISEALQHAKDELVKRKLLEEARKANIKAKVTYSLHGVSPFDAWGIKPAKSEWNPSGYSLSEKQKAVLVQNGFKPQEMLYVNQRKALTEIFRRKMANICSPKMEAWLAKNGYPPTTPRDQAAIILNAWKANDWCRPTKPPDLPGAKPNPAPTPQPVPAGTEAPQKGDTWF